MNDNITTAVPATGNNLSASITMRSYERIGRTRAVTTRECMTNVDGCCTLDYLASFLGRPDLRKRMVDDGYLQADGLPYQHYLDCGYLTAVEGDDGQPEVLATPHGMSWLYNHYGMTEAARVKHLLEKNTVQ